MFNAFVAARRCKVSSTHLLPLWAMLALFGYAPP
jgi:hypothetical protein